MLHEYQIILFVSSDKLIQIPVSLPRSSLMACITVVVEIMAVVFSLTIVPKYMCIILYGGLVCQRKLISHCNYT